jgi:hypothetical protein
MEDRDHRDIDHRAVRVPQAARCCPLARKVDAHPEDRGSGHARRRQHPDDLQRGYSGLDPDAHQAQIDALSAQLANLQQSVAANKTTDSAQAQ